MTIDARKTDFEVVQNLQSEMPLSSRNPKSALGEMDMLMDDGGADLRNSIEAKM